MVKRDSAFTPCQVFLCYWMYLMNIIIKNFFKCNDMYTMHTCTLLRQNIILICIRSFYYYSQTILYLQKLDHIHVKHHIFESDVCYFRYHRFHHLLYRFIDVLCSLRESLREYNFSKILKSAWWSHPYVTSIKHKWLVEEKISSI